jgi:hypothetical protein
MNKKDLNQLTKINYRLDALTERWNKQFDQNMQELLQLSTLLKNIEDGYLETNEALLAE